MQACFSLRFTHMQPPSPHIILQTRLFSQTKRAKSSPRLLRSQFSVSINVLKPLQIERQRLAKEWEQEQEAKMQIMMRVAFVFYEGQGSTNHYEARAAIVLFFMLCFNPLSIFETFSMR